MSVALVVDCVARTESVERLLAEVRALAAASLDQEPGCLQFDVLQDQHDPLKIMLYEVYADATAAEAHKGTPHFERFIQAGVPLFVTHTLRPFRRAAP